MTAPDFGALVAAVFANEPHEKTCLSLRDYRCEPSRHVVMRAVRPCNCTREARVSEKVGRGIAAVRESDRRWYDLRPSVFAADRDAAAARAFEEACCG